MSMAEVGIGTVIMLETLIAIIYVINMINMIRLTM